MHRHTELWQKIAALRKQNYEVIQIAMELGYSESSIQRHIKLAREAGFDMAKPLFQRNWVNDNQYLGKLCLNGHDYKGTGQSVRFKGNGECCECRRYLEQRRFIKRKYGNSAA